MPDNKTVTFDALCAEVVESLQCNADGCDQEGNACISVADATAIIEDLFKRCTSPTPAAQSAGQEPIRQVKWHEGDGWVDVDRETFAEYADRALHKRILYADPVNGGERAIVDAAIAWADAKPDSMKACAALVNAVAACRGKRAADAQQVGGNVIAKLLEELDESNGLFVAMMHEKRPLSEIQEQVSANRTAIVAYQDARAALTSPAKVGGDEREVLIQSLKNAQEWIAASRDRCDEIERDRWDALQRVIDFLDRAALSADGGDSRRMDAIESGILLVRRLNPDSWLAKPVFGKTGKEYSTAREAIDAAIAANQSGKGGE